MSYFSTGMFERLEELVHFVSKNKVQRIEIIGEPSNYNSLVHQLYAGIQEGRYKSDRDAAKDLYDSTPENKNFKHLQYVLEQRLLNTVFFIDVSRPTFVEYKKAYYTCQKNVGAIYMLIGRNAKKTGVSLAERTIRIAIKYEFADIIISLTRILRQELTYGKNQKKYEYYNHLLKKNMKLLEAELFAEECSQKITLHHAGTRIIKKDILNDVIEDTNQLENMLQTYSHQKFLYPAYTTIINRYELVQDYEKVIEICNNALLKLNDDNKPINNGVLISLALFKILFAQIYLKNYTAAENVIQRCLNFYRTGTRTWYIVLERYLKICMFTKQYQKAYEILIQAQITKGIHKLFPVEQEIWEISRAYIHYLILIGKITPNTSEPQLNKFRYYKFLNEVPTYSKDKRGYNIAILVIQVLLLLQAEKYDDVINRTQSLQQYCYKYLRKNDSYRSNCFIKMLVKLIEAHFHKNGAIRKAQSYYEKLKAFPAELSAQTTEIEIVPYEYLWECILESLDNKFVKPKKKPEK